MNRPIICVGALVCCSCGQVLLVQTTKWRGLWGVPGGKVDWGETLEQAVRRELLEETGLVLQKVQQVQLQEAVLSTEFYKETHMILVDFLAWADGQVIPNEEIVAWKWLSLNEALEYPLNSYTYTLLKLAQQEGWS